MSPCAAVATGGGKSAILSEMARAFVAKGHRTLALTASKELVAQLSRHASIFGIDHGVYAVSHKRRDTHQPLIIAQVQSVWRKVAELGAFTCCIIDENHQVSKSETSMYAQALETLRTMNPKLRLIGLSATPWRMGEGFIYGPGKMFDECVANVTMKQLIDERYLTPLVGKSADCRFDDSTIKMRAGDFAANDLERVMVDEERVRLAVSEVIAQSTDRNKVLIFSSGLKHNVALCEEFARQGQKAVFVDGVMPHGERDAVLDEFRNGPVKYLINASVLTTGYDNPMIDCVALLRPTRSTVLLLQMVGRGLRLHPGKVNCKILDFGRIIETLGALDQIEQNIREERGKAVAGDCPMKACPTCKSIIHAALSTCPDCGHEFPKKLNHEGKASGAHLMGGVHRLEVDRVLLSPAWTNKAGLATVRVQYVGKDCTVTEHLCIEHAGYVRTKAIQTLANWPMRESKGRKMVVRNGGLYGLINGFEAPLTRAKHLPPFESCLIVPAAIDWEQQGKHHYIHKRYF